MKYSVKVTIIGTTTLPGPKDRTLVDKKSRVRYPFYLLALLCLSPLSAQLDYVADHSGAIMYHLDLTDVQQHELGVMIEFPAVPAGLFRLRMPEFSPGRYARHNFARNVYGVSARGADGRELKVVRESPTSWVIADHGGRVTFTYTLFANGGDGTYSGIDDRKLHLNMPASFIYGDRLNDRPIVLRLPPDQRSEWEVATQLVDLGGRRYAAPNYYYFYDSPTLVGRMMRDSFLVPRTDNGDVDTIEMVLMHETDPALFEKYVNWTEDIVLAQREVYGELPAFDYGRYTFLCSYNAYVGGDGMEHRNSTICSAPVPLEGYAERLIGTVSHEFFHCWNVERIRPASLEPFDFSHVNMSGELWFAEGFTSYYDDVSLVRAGVLAPEEYASGLDRQLNYVLLTPGRDYRGPIGMSRQAPFVDAATANDPDNYANTFISYYSYGATLGLALDLQLRERGHTLDELMRLMWQRYGRPEIPYHVNDIEMALAEVSQDSAWATGWFQDHIYGSDLPDLAPLLADYGIDLSRAEPDSVGFFGLRLSEEETGLTVSGTVYENNPLFKAGVNEGVVIKSLNDRTIADLADWRRAVADLRSGRRYEIVFEQLGRERRGTFEAATDPTYTIDWMEEVSSEVSERRSSWLGTGG